MANFRPALFRGGGNDGGGGGSGRSRGRRDLEMGRGRSENRRKVRGLWINGGSFSDFRPVDGVDPFTMGRIIRAKFSPSHN